MLGYSTSKRGRLQLSLLELSYSLPKPIDSLTNYLSFPTRREVVLYCARGGIRSQSVARWLSNSGVRASILDGGYKSFRRQVLELLDQLARHPKLVLNGRTGCGKTQLIRALSAEAQTISWAWHSIEARPLGDWPSRPSPTQQNFENLLVERYLQVKHQPCLLLEIESSIGPVHVPPVVKTL